VRPQLVHLSPYVPNRSGYNTRLQASTGQLRALIRVFTQDTGVRRRHLVGRLEAWGCGLSQEAALRSEFVRFAGDHSCASQSCYSWGLWLHLACMPAGPAGDPKADLQEVVGDRLEVESSLLDARAGQVILADKGYAGAELEAFLEYRRVTFLRPGRADEQPR
jgi:hypothetical protein